MPSRNVLREFTGDQYYHVYNRGVAKQPVFLDAQDKAQFLDILARHLDPEDTSVRNDDLPYDKYNVDLICYCLMKNHFHLLVYQPEDDRAIAHLMKSVSTAYTMYFNRRYQRVGPVFQGRFKAARIDSEGYFDHITRYIHLNPRTYRTYKWSSLPEFLTKRHTPWIHPERVLDMTPALYLKFLQEWDSKPGEVTKLTKELFGEK